MSLKVLQVVPGLDPRQGGVVAAVDGLAHALNREGVQVEVLSPYREGADWSLADRLESVGVRVTRVGPVRTPLGWHAAMKRTAREAVDRSDVVHVNGVWEEVQHQAANACKRLDKPLIISPHGMLDPWSLKQSATRKKLYLAWRMRRHLNAATRIHCCSRIERRLLDPLNLRPPHIVEANGLNFAEFDPLPPRNAFRARHPELKDKRIVLFLSRLHYKKGLDLLIPAFKQAAINHAVLVLAGPCEPAYQRELEALVRESGLSDDQVLFAGMQAGAQRIEAFVDAELFVLPSYQENFGIVVAESLATGTPVLISDQVNIWPEVEDAGVGTICKTTIPSVTEALRAALDSASSIGPQRCQAMAKERYDWQAIAKRWITHFEDAR